MSDPDGGRIEEDRASEEASRANASTNESTAGERAVLAPTVERADLGGPGDAYSESQIIMTTVRAVAPFVLTFGLFLVFHGADTPGGGFQGGAIVGSVVLMIAFAFGIDPTRRWLRTDVVVALVGGGVLAFVGVGLATVALGGAFLEYVTFASVLGIPDGTKWGMEAIEIVGIAAIVSGVVIGLFFATAAGYRRGPE